MNWYVPDLNCMYIYDSNLNTIFFLPKNNLFPFEKVDRLFFFFFYKFREDYIHDDHISIKFNKKN